VSGADLAGRVALVTGASGGIGAAIATCLAEAGAAVALQYRRAAPQDLLGRLAEQGARVAAFEADFSKPDAAEDLFTRVAASLGRPDILVNCAADQRMDGDAGFDEMLKTNVIAAEGLTRVMAEQGGGGAVVNISSIEAAHPAPGHGRYGASKAALEALTRAQAVEFGAQGLRVNAVAPGLVARDEIEADWPEGVARWQAACPLGRLGDARDVAHAVLFLVSDLAAWITGTVLTVDGGTTAGPGW